MNKIIDINNYKTKRNKSITKETNKYIKAWDKLTSEEKITMQELLEN